MDKVLKLLNDYGYSEKNKGYFKFRLAIVDKTCYKDKGTVYTDRPNLLVSRIKSLGVEKVWLQPLPLSQKEQEGINGGKKSVRLV